MRGASIVLILLACSNGPTGAGGAGGSGGTGGAGGDDVGQYNYSAIALPQVVDGAAWANAAVYPRLPVCVAVTGHSQFVRVRAGQVPNGWVDATDNHDGTWSAMVPIDGLSDGFTKLEAEASATGKQPIATSADLGIGRTGVQLTDFSQVGMAGTPRIHRINGGLWLTFTDRSAGNAEAWLRRIDGAARWMGDRIALVRSPMETLYARTAVGTQSIAVLYQQQGGPYTNYLKVVDFAGNERKAAIALDPTGMYGSFGADVAFDGTGFIAVWRSNDGMGGGQVMWLRVDEATGNVTGPVAVAKSGHDDPDGGFEPISFIAVAVEGDLSLVSFVRGLWSPDLMQSIPRSQVARVDNVDGTVRGVDFAGSPTDDTFHDEARVYNVDGAVVPLWSAVDLNDPNPNPPKLFFTAPVGMDGTLGSAQMILNAPGDRYEPVVIAHPTLHAVAAWLDGRTYETSQQGQIQLYVAPLSTMTQATVFPHARFVADTSELRGLETGGNVQLVWLDERHGMGIADPKPELWFETVWY